MKRRIGVLATAVMVIAVIVSNSMTTLAALEETTKPAYTGVSISSRNAGLELVRTDASSVTFELLGVEDKAAFATSAKIVDGVMQIYVVNSNTGSKRIQVGGAGEYENCVRVYIPDAEYAKFEIDIKDGSLRMEDFNAPVTATGDSGGMWLNDTTIYRGTYQLANDYGSLVITADTIQTDITASAKYGSLVLNLKEQPANLYVDTTNCDSSVALPNGWSSKHSVGTGSPKVMLSNTSGATSIIIGERQ